MKWWIKHWINGMNGWLSRSWTIIKNPWCWDLLHIQNRSNQFNGFCYHFIKRPNEFDTFYIPPNRNLKYGRLYIVNKQTYYCLALYCNGKNSSFGSDILISGFRAHYVETYKTLPRYYQVKLFELAYLPIARKKL